MAERRPKLLFDAIAAIDAALGFLAGHDLAAYETNLLLRSGVERQLEILGEACARLLREDASTGREVPASRMAIGLRRRVSLVGLQPSPRADSRPYNVFKNSSNASFSPSASHVP